MTRTKLKDRELPPYTRGEEIFNMVTHIVGGAFGVAALALCVIMAAMHKNIWGIASGAIYGVSMITVYTISSVYHGLKPPMAKKVMQVLDHCDIYFLIAGTYTPMLLTGLREYNPVLSWVIFGIVLCGSIVGIVFNAIDLKKYKALGMTCYFAIGWCIIFAVKPLLAAYPLNFFLWILAGGVVYTLGMIFYGLGRKKRYFHSIFHLFILGGSIVQFFGILFYCM